MYLYFIVYGIYYNTRYNKNDKINTTHMLEAKKKKQKRKNVDKETQEWG